MDQLDAMRLFVAVAKLGSFAEAARQLRLSPSVATRSVAQLEDQLGLMLLTRTTRSLRLTERGQIYLESCQQVLEDIEGITRRVRGENAEPRGDMRIAAPVCFGRIHVLPIVNSMLNAHRALSIRLSLSDRNAHLIDEGVDVAIRVGNLSDSSLVAVKLGAVSRMLVASPAYLSERGTPETPADLSTHDIISFESIDTTNDWRFGANETPTRVEPRLVVNTAEAAVAAAEASIGITRTLSYQVKKSVLAGRLIPVLQDFAPPPLPVSAVYPAGRIASPNVAAFVKSARGYFADDTLVPFEKWHVLDSLNAPDVTG